MVAAELGVNTLERGVTVSLRLLDTIRGKNHIVSSFALVHRFNHLSRRKYCM